MATANHELNECPFCAEEIDPHALVCQHCDSSLGRKIQCHNCSAQVKPNAKFCDACGAAVKVADQKSAELKSAVPEIDGVVNRTGHLAQNTIVSNGWLAGKNKKGRLWLVTLLILTLVAIANQWVQNANAENKYRQFLAACGPNKLKLLHLPPNMTVETYGNGLWAAAGQTGFLGNTKKEGTITSAGYSESDQSQTDEICADSLSVFQDFKAAKLAAFQPRIDKLLKDGHLFLLPSGTKVTVLKAYRHAYSDVPDSQSLCCCEEVTLDTGPRAGQKCFVAWAKKIDPLWRDSLTFDQRKLCSLAQAEWCLHWDTGQPLPDSDGLSSEDAQLINFLYSNFRNCDTSALQSALNVISSLQSNALDTQTRTLAPAADDHAEPAQHELEYHKFARDVGPEQLSPTPSIKINGETGTIEWSLRPHDSAESEGSKIAKAIYAAATQHNELKVIFVRCKMSGTVDEYGNVADGSSLMGTAYVSDLKSVREYKTDDGYAGSITGVRFALQLRNMTHGDALDQ